jgi:hypothetical protein
MNPIARYWTNGKKKPAISNGFWTSSDCLGLCLGGGGGSRTRVPAFIYLISMSLFRTWTLIGHFIARSVIKGNRNLHLLFHRIARVRFPCTSAIYSININNLTYKNRSDTNPITGSVRPARGESWGERTGRYMHRVPCLPADHEEDRHAD